MAKRKSDRKFISKTVQFLKQTKNHLLFPLLALITGGWVSKLMANWTENPVFGVIGVAATIYLTVAILLSATTCFQNKPKFHRFCLTYIVIPLLVSFSIVWPCRNKLVVMFTTTPTENVFVTQTSTKNPIGTPQYELLIEFGTRYHDESVVNLEVDVGNAWLKECIQGWWDKSHLTQSTSCSIPFDKPVTLYFLGNTSNVVTGPQHLIVDMNNPPIFKLKFDAIPITPEERSLYLYFGSNKPLKLKSAKFNGKTVYWD